MFAFEGSKIAVAADGELLREAREMGINVARVIEDALRTAIEDARGHASLKENAEALAEHGEWIERNGHPLADIMVGPLKDTWKER